MRFFDFIKNNWLSLSIIVVLFIINIILIFIIGFNKSTTNKIDVVEPIAEAMKDEPVKAEKKIKIDIKGAVKKPGVYEMSDTAIVNDVIALAGGLKSNGTTKNINLSKRLSNEMVIYISTASELKKRDSDSVEATCKENTVIIEKCENASIVEIEPNSSDEVKENTSNETSSNNANEINAENKISKVNINTATKEELMTLNGIGESKALSILEYRTQNPFKTIDELKNIKGIGESVFDKVKDYITV